jgi:hypothetical protein
MATEFRILDYNYMFQSNVDITATSQQASFPASNVSEYIRAKSWRSNGNYTITTSNNKLDFQETALGPEITAVLAVGSYTSSTLCTEIKTQLEAETLNTRTYTVTFSSLTGKFTITGQTFLSLLFATGSSSASSVASSIGFSASDYTGGTGYSSSFIAIHTHEALVIDLKSSEEIDSLGLFFDPTDGIKLSSNAVIKIQANQTNLWTSPAVNVTLTMDEERDVITYFWTSSQEYRYWRVYIEDPKNTDLFVELGTIFLGKATQLSKVPDNGFTFTQEDRSLMTENEYGHQYIDVYPIRKSITFNYSVLPYSDIATLDTLFRRVGIHTPIMMTMDPLETQFDKDQFTLYGRFDKKYIQQHQTVNFYKTDLSLVETL